MPRSTVFQIVVFNRSHTKTPITIVSPSNFSTLQAGRFDTFWIVFHSCNRREQATLWTWTKPAIGISTDWLETTSAKALVACWRLDASEKSAIGQPFFPSPLGHTSIQPSAAFHKLVHSQCGQSRSANLLASPTTVDVGAGGLL